MTKKKEKVKVPTNAVQALMQYLSDYPDPDQVSTAKSKARLVEIARLAEAEAEPEAEPVGPGQMIIDAIDEWAKAEDVTVTMLGEDPTEFASAIVGTVSVPRAAVVYLRSRVIECLERQGMTEEEAVEWYEYNTERGVQYLPAESNPPILVDDVI